MTLRHLASTCCIYIFCAAAMVHAQTTPPNPNATNADAQSSTEKISTGLKEQEQAHDFELTLGIGSLITGPDESDYTNTNNILNSTNLGRSSPQYLVGVSLRAPFCVNPFSCKSKEKTPASPAVPAADWWRVNPWSGFISLKFSSSASQTINGYVLGGSFQVTHYLNVLVGFALTPFNEASPGLRVTASQYVTAQQKLGNDLNYDPIAMLNGTKYAFDGFSLIGSNGQLIYKGTPLETHYHGGVVIGVSIPISLESAFSGHQ